MKTASFFGVDFQGLFRRAGVIIMRLFCNHRPGPYNSDTFDSEMIGHALNSPDVPLAMLSC